jgi:hypothetical protein
MQIQSYSQPMATPNRLLSSRDSGFQPGSPEDLVTVSGQSQEMFDAGMAGKLMGGMIYGVVGFAGGAVVGGIGGTALGNSFGHPMLGVTVGLIGCGLLGGAVGAYLGSRD